MDTNTYKSQHCECVIEHSTDYTLVVNGVILHNKPIKDNIISFIASSPPDHRSSYTGSALPFANEKMAFENTPNIGEVKLQNGRAFSINIKYPNSYYAGLGTVIIPPTLFVSFTDINDTVTTVNIPVSKGIPYRMLTYPMQYTKARKDCMFYDGGWELPVRTQEQILLDSAYPSLNKMDPNFWGLKPPM